MSITAVTVTALNRVNFSEEIEGLINARGNEQCEVRNYIGAIETSFPPATLIVESHVLWSHSLAGTTEVDLANSYTHATYY